MGRIVVTEFLSLDGVMEAPGGDDDFVRGAWTFDFDRGPEGDDFKTGETMDAEAMLLGRRTYEGFSQAWPKYEGEFADKFNTMPKYVVSKTLKDPEWTNTTVLSGDPIEEVRALREREGSHIIVQGSAQLVQALVDAELVDELRLMVFPIVLGTGKRLFGDTSQATRFALKSSDVAGDGVALMVYERA